MKIDTDILIVGGGLNGTTAALAFAAAGLDVTIVDPISESTRAAPTFDGRGYALALTSKLVLQALGVWDQIAVQSQPILQIKVSDGRMGEGPSPFVLEFDHAEIEEGPMGYMIQDRHLRPALLKAVAEAPNIVQLDNTRVLDHVAEPGYVSAQLDNGTSITSRLLVGADGSGSPTAERAKIKRIGWDYGQTALVCAVAHERPHKGIAHQFFMPSGPLAILPLTNNRSSIVWTEATSEAARIQSRDDAGYIGALRPRFGDFLGEISLAGDRFTFPLALSIAEHFVGPRLALIGDAAHRVHPIAGQGLNAGLKDVAALVQIVVDALRRGEDIGAMPTLDRYQSWRRFDAASLAIATDGFNRLFSNDVSAIRSVRDLGLGIVNALPSLRRGLIREAAGLTGDLPRLMQGKLP